MLRKRTRNKRLLALILAGVVATTTCQDFGFVVNAESNYNNLQQKYCKDADENSTEDVEASSEETSVYSESTEDGSENETSENETSEKETSEEEASEKETSEEEASEKETSEEEASEEKTSDIETEETSDFEVTEQLSSEDEENTTEDITQENTELETEETDLAVLEANGVNIASYVKVENGKITKYTGSDISNIVIPEKINGVTITAIGNEVFKGHSEIASVTFPDTLKSIGNYAFYETSLGTNTQLGTLKIPASVTQIGYYAFSKCKYLGTVEFTDVSQPSIDGITFNEYYNSGCTFSECTYLETIKLSNNIVTLPSCFASSCKQLETVKWGSNLKYINTSAFENCSSLKNANLSNTKVEKIGHSSFKGCASVSGVVFPNTLSSIGNYAFNGASIGTNTELGKLIIPSSVSYIGYYAFSQCKYLGTVEFTDVSKLTNEGIIFDEYYGSGFTFQGCDKLSNIKLSNNIVTLPSYFASNCKALGIVQWSSRLKSIHDNAFQNCTGLEMADLSKTSLVKIGKNAFANCTAIKKVVFPNTLESIDTYAFNGASIGTNTELGKLIIPSSVSYIGYYAFSQCKYLGTVEFTDVSKPTNEGIVFDEYYGSGFTFQGCDKLSNIKLSNNIVTLPSYFASNCKALGIVQWSSRLKSIHDNAFQNCTGLEMADLSKTSLVKIGKNAFANCTAIKKVVFPNTLESIDTYAFNGASIGTNTELGKLIIPSSVSYIGYYAFSQCKYLGTVEFTDVSKPTFEGIVFDEYYGSGFTFHGCENLSNIKLSNNIVTLPSYFAYDCKQLEAVQWGSNLKNIHGYAFKNCKALKKLDISKNNITQIGNYAFENCTSLEKVIFSNTLETIGNNAFHGASMGTNTKLGTVVIPASVGSVGYYAFSECQYLGYVVFEDVSKPTYDGVMLVDYYGTGATFMNCPRLVSIKTSNNVKKIPSYFASGCPKLTSITFASDELTIEKKAFYVNNKTVTAVDGNSPAINKYDWASDNRVLKSKYTIIFHNNMSDNKTSSQVVPRDAATALLSNPFVNEGHTFVNWNTKPDGSGTSYSNNANIKNLAEKDKTIHLYAQWKVKTYQLTLHANGGKIGNAATKKITLKYGETYGEVLKYNPVFTGWDFAGWYTSEGEDAKTYDWSKLVVKNDPIINLYAHWTTLKYNVVLDANTTDKFSIGSVITGKGVKVNAKAGQIYNSEGVVKSTMNSIYYGLAIEYGEYIKLTGNEYLRPGYTLAGWNTKPNGSGTKYLNESVMPLASKDITLYAQWKLNTYKIKYDLDDGKNSTKNPNKYTVLSGDIELSAPTKEGAKFAGWIDSNGKVITKIASGSHKDMFLKAKWEDIKYTIVYHNSSSYSSVTEDYTVKNIGYSDKVNLIDAAKHFKVKNEYAGKNSIVGWTTKAGGKGNKYSLDKSYSKLTKKDLEVIDLYAVWGANSYEIIYNLNGGVNHKNNPMIYTYNSKKAVSISKPTRAGYIFDGWEASGEAVTGFAKGKIAAGTTGNLKLTAKWKNISYIVKLDKNNSYATKNPGIVENYDLSYDQAKTISAKSLYANDYYELTGFNTKANGKGEFVPIDSNGNMVLKNLSVKNNAKVKLFAQWKIHEYKITYVNLNPNKTYNPNNSYNTQLRGVKNKNAEVYVPTKKLTFSKPTCAGYVFVGWYKDAACTQKITSIPKGSKGNIVVYSKWKTK